MRRRFTAPNPPCESVAAEELCAPRPFYIASFPEVVFGGIEACLSNAPSRATVPSGCQEVGVGRAVVPAPRMSKNLVRWRDRAPFSGDDCLVFLDADAEKAACRRVHTAAIRGRA